MWPLLLDMTKEESIQNLRNLELEAYAHLVSALRAQGPLSSDKRKILKETGVVLNITQERHKAEVRRAISDEKLNTIAYHVTGHTESLEDWAQEGRRLMPLLPRMAPQTAYSALADENAETTIQNNKEMPCPSSTERKRQSIIQMITTVAQETSKTSSFRIPDPPNMEEQTKKRKLPICAENSSLAQHLMAPKICRIQQLYRQRSKPKQKEIHKKPEQDHTDFIQQHRVIQQVPLHLPTNTCSPQPSLISQKVNVLQNISIQPAKEPEQSDHSVKLSEQIPSVPVCSNENQAPRPKLISNVKPNANITFKQMASPGPSGELHKSLKLCAPKKPQSKAMAAGQKLIVVSNTQTIPSNSILQRTLQIPFVKNVSIKNFEKFKIVSGNSTSTGIQVTNVSNAGMSSVKHKVVTVKTNPNAKKVIPLSQLQVLNSKGSIKVLPLGGKIVGKTVTTTSGPSPPLYIMNAIGAAQKFTKSISSVSSAVETNLNVSEGAVKNKVDYYADQCKENGKSLVLEDILKASSVISEEVSSEDYDTKIEEFHISQNQNENKANEVDMVSVKHEKITNNGEKDDRETQIYDYSIVPVNSVKNESTEIKEVANEELIKAEHVSNQNEVKKSLKEKKLPQVILDAEHLKTSKSNELY